MARVFIDAHLFSESWFKAPLSEMLGCKNVTFTYGESQQILREMARVRQALGFYKMVGSLKTASNKSRREDAGRVDLEHHQKYLQGEDCYNKCTHCDDAHIFSLVYVKPTPYIFSNDHRMAKCRDVINKHIDKRYCNFIIISDNNTYKNHRGGIFK